MSSLAKNFGWGSSGLGESGIFDKKLFNNAMGVIAAGDPGKLCLFLKTHKDLCLQTRKSQLYFVLRALGVEDESVAIVLAKCLTALIGGINSCDISKDRDIPYLIRSMYTFRKFEKKKFLTLIELGLRFDNVKGNEAKLFAEGAKDPEIIKILTDAGLCDWDAMTPVFFALLRDRMYNLLFAWEKSGVPSMFLPDTLKYNCFKQFWCPERHYYMPARMQEVLKCLILGLLKHKLIGAKSLEDDGMHFREESMIDFWCVDNMLRNLIVGDFWDPCTENLIINGLE